MPTIRDVARLSKTSVGTVSRYLNGYKIKDANVKKIEDAIKELNFSRNTIARGLKTNITFTVGILIPELSNIFTNNIIDGMEKIFDEEGYNIIVCDSRNSLVKEKEKLNLLKDKMVDGILLMPVSNEKDHVEEIIDSGIPIVLIDRLIGDIKIDGVVVDNINGSYSAIESLINNGHKNIGIIAGPDDIYTAYERLVGSKRALTDYNINIKPENIAITNYKIDGGYLGFKNLIELDNPPTAFFTSNYFTTLGALKAIVEKGLKIGEDISLVGYDQLEFFEIFSPPISVVSQPRDEIGTTAAKLLLKRMKNDLSNFPTIIRLKTGLTLTNSVKKIF